jgi:hypothetical protein
MKKILFISISLLFISCGVQSIPVTPESFLSNIPELNTSNNTEIGITLVSKEVGFKYKAIKITKGRKAKPGYLVREIKEGDIFINNSYTSKYELYSNVNDNDNSFGIAIPISEENPMYYTNSGNGLTIIKINTVLEYSKLFVPVPKKEYNKQEFIYNGRVGTALKFIYREYVDDYARPAFSQDLQYDLAESKIIGFRGLRIEVLSATNTNIEYKVLSYFNK